MALRLRRGTNAERLLVTFAEGELVYTTDTKLIYAGDGSTIGGNLIAGLGSVQADGTPKLGADLDLNSNDIIGTGNINIAGNVTATGNINLGDEVTDIVTFTAGVTGNLVPSNNVSSDIGSPTKRWREGWIDQLNVQNQLNAGRINADIIADDSTVVFNASTGKVSGSSLEGTISGCVFDGDISGSVFGDDSSTIIDATNNTIIANALSITDITASGGTDLRFNAVTTNFNRAQSTSSRVFVHSTTAAGFGTGLFNLINTHTNASTDDLAFSRARGTPDSLVVINADDKLGGLAFNGHDGSAYQFGAAIDSYATAISANNITANVCIRTRQGAIGTLAIGLKVEGDQTVKLNTLDVLSGDILTINQAIKLPISTAEPATPADGQIAIANGVSWNPASNAKQSLVAYLGGAWVLVAAEA